VRNPWDRAVSYYHWLREQSFKHPAVGLSKSLGFDDFMRHSDTVAAFRNNPASFYMIDAAGRERCNVFVRMEYLEQDLAPVEDHLGFSLTLGQVNHSNRSQNYREYYDESLAAFLGELCAKDVMRFNYHF
jgi:hypothetical protein